MTWQIWKPWQQAAVLAAITFVFFSSTLSSGFVYDARMQILTGDFIHDWRNWPAVLTGRVLGLDVLDFNRPAMLASLMLDAAAWGREPFGYHLTSVLVHVANALLLWEVLRSIPDSTAGRIRPGLVSPGLRQGIQPRPEASAAAPPALPEDRTSTTRSLAMLLAALVFALHPVVSEAVCEPTYREDLLVALFTLSALVLAMRHDPATPGLDCWRALGCTTLSLLAVASKEAGVVAPLLLAAYWWLFRRREPRPFWAAAIGGAAFMVVAYLSARFLLEPRVSAVFTAKPEYLGGSFAQAMLLEPRILALYAQLVLFPINLCVDYGLASVGHLPLPLALSLLVTLAVAGGIAARYDRRLLFAFCIVLLPLAPVANLVPIYRPAADRYLYLPMAGVAVVVACLLDAPWLISREKLRQRALVGCMAAVAVLGMACVERQAVWASSLALWDDGFRKNPGSLTNAMGLGEALREAGRIPEAEKLTREAIRLSNEKRGDVWATLALILDAQNRTPEAAAALAKALEIDPGLSDPDAKVKSLAMERPMAEELERLLDTLKVGWPEREKTGY
jgi:hypothetical protein